MEKVCKRSVEEGAPPSRRPAEPAPLDEWEWAQLPAWVEEELQLKARHLGSTAFDETDGGV